MGRYQDGRDLSDIYRGIIKGMDEIIILPEILKKLKENAEKEPK